MATAALLRGAPACDSRCGQADGAEHSCVQQPHICNLPAVLGIGDTHAALAIACSKPWSKARQEVVMSWNKWPQIPRSASRGYPRE